jgi:hypothetical protein
MVIPTIPDTYAVRKVYLAGLYHESDSGSRLVGQFVYSPDEMLLNSIEKWKQGYRIWFEKRLNPYIDT